MPFIGKFSDKVTIFRFFQWEQKPTHSRWPSVMVSSGLFKAFLALEMTLEQHARQVGPSCCE